MQHLGVRNFFFFSLLPDIKERSFAVFTLVLYCAAGLSAHITGAKWQPDSFVPLAFYKSIMIVCRGVMGYLPKVCRTMTNLLACARVE